MFKNSFIQEQKLTPTWGKFVTDFGFEAQALDIVGGLLQSRHRHNYSSVAGLNDVFDEYVAVMNASRMAAEDQCTERWYYDVFTHFLSAAGETRHVVEVGCFTGSSSRWLYVASRLCNFTLDIVDANINFLAYARARMIETFGELADNVRFFHGDVPTYVRNAAIPEQRSRVSFHHDGAHTFNECLQDFASMSFIKDNLKHVIIQDTNHRSAVMDYYAFVDMAAYAVFGLDCPYRPIGQKLSVSNPVFDAKIYFEDSEPEGKIIDISKANFRVPHRSVTADEFFAGLNAPATVSGSN